MGRLNANQPRELALTVSKNLASYADGGPELGVRFHLFLSFLQRSRHVNENRYRSVFMSIRDRSIRRSGLLVRTAVRRPSSCTKARRVLPNSLAQNEFPIALDQGRTW